MLKSVITAGAVLGVALLGAVELDHGGTTFDFAKITEQRFGKTAVQGTNLFRDSAFSKKPDPKDFFGWKSNYCYIHDASVPGNDPRRRKIRPHVVCTFENGTAKVVKSSELRKVCGAKVADNVSGAWNQRVLLPDTKGGVYQLRFFYKTRNEGKGGNCVLISQNGPHKVPYRGKNLNFKVLPVPGSAGWQLYQKEVSIVPGAATADIVFRIDGVGELQIKEPCFTRVQQANMIEVKLSPHGFLDSEFYISAKQPAQMTFVWRRTGAKDAVKFRKLDMVLILPDAVKLLDVPELKVTGSRKVPGGMEYTVDMRSWSYRLKSIDGFDFYLVIPVLVTTEKSSGDLGRGTLCIKDGNKVLSNVEQIRFKGMKSISGPVCKRYYPGYYIGGRYQNFNSKANYDCYARFLRQLGVRWIVCQPPKKEQLKSWRDAGVEIVTPEWYYCANGYRVGNSKGRPESDKYKSIGKSALRDFDMAACPASIYEERPFFKEKVLPELKKVLEGSNGLWANWEPYMFEGKGCFCDVCRKHFAQFIHVPEEQLKKKWPSELARGRKYYEQWVKFRCTEHARLVKKIHEKVIEFSGKEKSLGFIPGIAWCEMATCWRSYGGGKEVHQSYYADALRWIDPWGPYPWWCTQTPYVYDKAGNLRTFYDAQETRKGVDQDYQSSKRPKLLAFPHGIQGDACITQPESIEMDLNSFFFHGFEASTLYIFPRGYDNRYWAAFARAAKNSALYEDFVFDGKRVDGKVKLTPESPYARPCGQIDSKYFPEVKNVPMLQYTAWENKGETIVAVFNFWQKGECFFRLQLEGLSFWKKYEVSCGDRLFANENKRSYSASELKKGILLHAGAIRTAVYRITPVSNRNFAETVKPEDMRKAMKAALPALKAAAAADEAYEKRYGVKESKLINQNNAGITVKADNTKGFLTITSKDASIKLNAGAMSVASWIYKGVERSGGDGKIGLGTVAFWEPSLSPTPGFFTVTAQEAIPGGVRITGEWEINNRVSSKLSELKLTSVIEITKLGKELKFTVKLQNISTAEAPKLLDVGFRFHCFPNSMARGKAVISANGKSVDYKRNYGRDLFSAGDRFFDTVCRKLYEIPGSSPTKKISSSTIRLVGAKGEETMVCTPAKEFAGIALWDSASQYTTTFEPCFKMVKLPATTGQAEYTLVLSAK